MVVVGAGRIGKAFALRAAARSLPVTLVDRTQGWEVLDGPSGSPILLAVRTQDLGEVITRLPAHRHGDVVLMQNGAIRELVVELGLSDPTRVVLYVLVSSAGGDIEKAQRSPVSGRHAAAVASWFEALGVPSVAMHPLRFAAYELEKLVWLCANGPLCEIHSCTVGEVVRHHRDELDDLVHELLPAGRAAWGVEPEPAWVVERCVGWSELIPSYRASVKEWPWRNGWIRDVAAQFQLPMPMHEEMLARLGHLDR